jgi:hypothetical protein
MNTSSRCFICRERTPSSRREIRAMFRPMTPRSLRSGAEGSSESAYSRGGSEADVVGNHRRQRDDNRLHYGFEPVLCVHV